MIKNNNEKNNSINHDNIPQDLDSYWRNVDVDTWHRLIVQHKRTNTIKDSYATYPPSQIFYAHYKNSPEFCVHGEIHMQ